MSRKQQIEEFTNILAVALRHKIGSIVNKHEIYSAKYSKDADMLINSAKKIVLGVSFNFYEKQYIKEILKKKLYNELASKDFLNNKKFEIMDDEMNRVLKEFDIFE